MLKQLSIKNYALIQELEITFNPGLTTITGETGAGKSILLGGLGLALGNRADFSALQDKGKKCVIEVLFDLSAYKLNKFFERNDLDFEVQSLIRREITPQGKSRAFINDTPVNLDVLRKLGDFLMDVHSQHQSLKLGDTAFHMDVVDTIAENSAKLKDYRLAYTEYSQQKKVLEELKTSAAAASTEEDYLKFQFNELEELSPREAEQEELEKEQQSLEHIEEIKKVLTEVAYSMSEQEASILSNLSEFKNKLEAISNYHQNSQALAERMKSAIIELSDIAHEVSSENEKLQYDPERNQIIEDRLSAIYHLQQKHKVGTVAELLELMETFDIKLNEIANYDLQIEKLQKDLDTKLKDLKEKAKEISTQRIKAFPKLKSKLEKLLSTIGMPHAKLEMKHSISDQIHKNGLDELEILFTANKGSEPQSIQKTASGGELSRLMLAIKSVLADYRQLPTIIFDEIDTGVSGDVANKMGNILKNMSVNRQVISITHLPQLAAKGSDHLFVHKKTINGKSNSVIRRLTEQERLEQLAIMLSGESMTQAALDNARELLNQ